MTIDQLEKAKSIALKIEYLEEQKEHLKSILEFGDSRETRVFFENLILITHYSSKEEQTEFFKIVDDCFSNMLSKNQKEFERL